MAVIEIPTSTDTAYRSQKCRLDGRDFVLRFSYNEREDRYYVDILDEEETPILRGLKLVSNWRLLRHYHHDPRVPPGELMATDLTGDNSPPSFGELGIGKRVELTYFTEDELADIDE